MLNFPRINIESGLTVIVTDAGLKKQIGTAKKKLIKGSLLIEVHNKTQGTNLLATNWDSPGNDVDPNMKFAFDAQLLAITLLQCCTKMFKMQW